MDDVKKVWGYTMLKRDKNYCIHSIKLAKLQRNADIAIFLLIAVTLGSSFYLYSYGVADGQKQAAIQFSKQERLIAQSPVKDAPQAILEAKNVIVTSYSLKSVMANGKKPHFGVAACPRWLNFGTKVKIEGVEYTCEDHMSVLYPNRFDVWLPQVEEAKKWGKKKLTIRLYD